MGLSNDLGRIDGDASAGNKMISEVQPLPSGVRNTFDGFTSGKVVERQGGDLPAPVVGTTGGTPNLDNLGVANAPRTADLDAALGSLFGND